jgi:hypothetical protein
VRSQAHVWTTTARARGFAAQPSEPGFRQSFGVKCEISQYVFLQEKNRSIVIQTITSIASDSAYYAMLNVFVVDNMHLLEGPLQFLLHQRGRY